MQRFLKNLDYATALPLAAQVAYQPGQIASKTLVQNAAVSMTLFAFDQGARKSAHTPPLATPLSWLWTVRGRSASTGRPPCSRQAKP